MEVNEDENEKFEESMIYDVEEEFKKDDLVINTSTTHSSLPEGTSPTLVAMSSTNRVQGLVEEIESKIVVSSGWERFETEDGTTYYYNAETDTSQWENPDEESSDYSPPAAAEEEEAGAATLAEEEDNEYNEALTLITKLHKAVDNEKPKQVEMLVNAGIDVNALDREGKSPIFYSRSLEMLDLLLSLGSTVPDKLAHELCVLGNVDMLERILQYYQDEEFILNGDFPLLDDEGNTPLHISAEIGDLECVSHLLKYSVNDATVRRVVPLAEYVNYEGLTAVQVAKDNIVQVLQMKALTLELEHWKEQALKVEALQKEVSYWKERSQESEARYQEESSNAAYWKEYAEQLQQQVDYTQQGNNDYHYVELDNDQEEHNESEVGGGFEEQAMEGGETDQDYYTHQQEGEVEQEPRQTPVDPEKIGKVWMKFFERAAKASLSSSSSSSIVPSQDIVASAPSNKNQWQDPNNALAAAVDLIDVDLVQESLVSGASGAADLSDSSDMESMLHRCCALCWDDKPTQRKIVKIASLLIDYGADIDVTDIRGVAPIHISSSVGNSGLVQLLLQNACIVNVTDGNGDTPLHLASMGDSSSHLKTVQMLVRYGADIHARNLQDNTPADCARVAMVLSERPGKHLCQIVEMLQELVKVAGDDMNPFGRMALGGSSPRAKKRNPYRQVEHPGSPRRWPSLQHEEQDEEAVPSPGKDGGWFTNLLGKVLTKTDDTEKDERYEDNKNVRRLVKPPSDRELMMDQQLQPPPDLQQALDEAKIQGVL